jgi:poly-gamma-glutamate synthesis protein (capsule biosynthesis protein)
MAKKKIKIKKKFRICAIVILVIALGVFALDFFDISSYFIKSKKEKKEVEVKVPQEYEVNLFMVGDALIHSCVYNDAKTGNGDYDFKPQIELIKEISSKYDLAYYNQETVLGGTELGLSNYPMFNSPQQVGDAFLDAGFNLVSLATNHTMDKGERGVTNSVNYWNSHKDQAVTSGQWLSFEDRDKSIATIYEKNGIKYAFISYTTWTNGLETPRGKEYLNNVYSEEKAAADIAKVKDKADIIIVAMHWGTEYYLGVDSSQTKIANFLASQGVQLIIGAHPHVVEPVEYINDGKTFVIYSLGNIISDQEGNERLTGLMMSVKIKKKVDVDGTTTVTVEEPKAELSYTKSNYCKNFKVYPYSKLNNSILSNYESLRDKYQGVVSSRYPELQWGLAGE